MNPTETDSARAKALAYLERHTVLTLATDGPVGLWAAAVFYANEGFELIFLSAATTRHSQNLEANPWVAGTIQENYSDWPDIQGVQLEGPVKRLEGSEQADAIARYLAKYPKLKGTSPVIQPALSKVDWYRVTPERLYFVDNSKGFGHRDEILGGQE